jgi:guanosine-3',5'-bis(diphosphate) 3'-pyrophosphohydrolase
MLVTETHETFFARISPWMAPKELMDVQVAYTVAKAAHRYQFRKETNPDGTQQRYFDHPRRVAIYLLDKVGVTNHELVVTALLHDTLEDTKLSADMIAHLFGQNIAKNVKLLSKLPKQGYYERLLKFGDENVATVKLADRIDNLSSMIQLDPMFQNRQREDTKEHIYPLFRLVKNEQTRKILMDDLVVRTEPKTFGF